MRQAILILIIISIAIFTGCSNKESNISSGSSDSHYNNLIAQAKELDKQGNSEEAVNVLAKVVIKDEDMKFFSELLDKTNGKKLTAPLTITDKSSKRNGEFMVVSGSINNKSTETHKNIKVKVVYLDDNGNIIDTDWTYAVDSVGIKPNESKRFELMTKYVNGMSKFKFEIIQ